MEDNEIIINESESAAEKLPKIDPTDSEAIAKYIVKVLDSKKARDIKLLHVEDRTSIADYFVICSATSRTQIKSLVDEVEYKLGLRGVKADHTEGRESGWMLLDFSTVILHVFSTDAREFYKLDRLYADAKETDISALVTED